MEGGVYLLRCKSSSKLKTETTRHEVKVAVNKHRKYLSHMVLGLQDKSKIVRWLGPSGGGAQTSRVHPSHNQKVLVWITTSHPTMSCKCAPVGKTSAASCPVTWTRTDLNKCAPEWGMYLGIPAFQVFCFASSHNFGIITWKGKKKRKKKDKWNVSKEQFYLPLCE